MVYANKTGVPYVVILGEDEEKSKVVSFKNMTTGEQETVALTEVAGRLKELLSACQMPSVITQE
jgi:histidyl-tRNA synthetase